MSSGDRSGRPVSREATIDVRLGWVESRGRSKGGGTGGQKLLKTSKHEIMGVWTRKGAEMRGGRNKSECC